MQITTTIRQTIPDVDFFTRLGMLVIDNFLDAEVCAKLRAEARVNANTPANVGIENGYTVDEEQRRTKYAFVSEEAISSIESRLLSIKPAVEKHFSKTLAGCQKPAFLVYKEGDFFRLHCDNSNNPGYPQTIRDRQVSVVIFLNGETEEPEPDSYCGGRLIFRGGITTTHLKFNGLRLQFPLAGKTGLLIAFPTDVAHEVTPVTHGERYTIVSWFL